MKGAETQSDQITLDRSMKDCGLHATADSYCRMQEEERKKESEWEGEDREGQRVVVVEENRGE